MHGLRSLACRWVAGQCHRVQHRPRERDKRIASAAISIFEDGTRGLREQNACTCFDRYTHRPPLRLNNILNDNRPLLAVPAAELLRCLRSRLDLTLRLVLPEQDLDFLFQLGHASLELLVRLDEFDVLLDLLIKLAEDVDFFVFNLLHQLFQVFPLLVILFLSCKLRRLLGRLRVVVGWGGDWTLARAVWNDQLSNRIILCNSRRRRQVIRLVVAASV